MENKLIESIAYILPAAVTGFVAYYMFSKFIKHQKLEKKITLLTDKKKETLSIKLQAFERMLLFCDRIHPIKLITRVPPVSNTANDYLQLLIANINQEFEHNLVQQIYLSNQTWAAIIAAKTTVINKLKLLAENANSAHHLRDLIAKEYSKNTPATETAITFIKSEAKKLL